MAKSKSNGKLWLIVAIVAVVLAAVIAFLVCTDAGTNWNKYCQWGHDYDEYGFCTRCGEEKDTNAQAEYFQIEADANANKVKLAQIARKYYSTMGIPASVESAYTLTATISPSDADNQRVVWRVEFVNPESEWARGKDPLNYVKAQPTVDGSNQATVTCLQAFSEPINVVAASEDNEEGATASCLCDYVKRVVGVDLDISTDTLMFGTIYTVGATPLYGEGTIDGDYHVYGYTLSLVSSISNAIHGLSATSQTVSNGSVLTKYTAKYNCTPAQINTDLSSHTFSFNGSDVFEVFGTYETTVTGSSGEVINSDVSPYLSIPDHKGSAEEAIATLRSLVNNTFKQKVNEISGPHMTFRFNFSYTYEGKSYIETTATADLKFDAETLAIHVVSISLDNDHIVF